MLPRLPIHTLAAIKIVPLLSIVELVPALSAFAYENISEVSSLRYSGTIREGLKQCQNQSIRLSLFRKLVCVLREVR